ncbi:family 20 glycosylhydrolase [Ligilactobacillus sp. LYQ135]
MKFHKIVVATLIAFSFCSVPNKILANNVSPYTVYSQKKSNDVTQNNILMLDVARRKMTKSQILQVIKNVDPHKFQFIQLHLNDNEGFAVKTNILHNTTNKNALSLEEIKDIVNYANQKGINIIPDIDVPAHCQAIINQLNNCNSPWLDKDIIMSDDTLDYTNPETLNFVKQLYAEILPAFNNQKHTYWMIGGDEVVGNGNCAIQFSNFINKLNDYLNRKGFQTIVWNDCINPKVLANLNDNITVNYWTTSDANTSAQQIANHGNPVRNTNHYANYYNTVDLHNTTLRKQKVEAMSQQKNAKSTYLWGSNSQQEKQISNKDVISYIKQVQNSIDK